MGLNKNLDKEQILQAFEMYEQGNTMSKCFLWLGVSRQTFQCYLTGETRIECRLTHLKLYPEGKVAKYKCKSFMAYKRAKGFH